MSILQWVMNLGTIVMVAVALHYINIVMYRYLYDRLGKDSPYVAMAIRSLYRPIGFLIWYYAAYILVYVIHAHINFGASFIQGLSFINGFVLVVMFVWVASRGVRLFEEYATTSKKYKKRLDKNSVFVIGRLMRIALGIFGVILFMQQAGVSQSVLAAFGGGGAIVLGIAGKDLFANFFGGLLLFFNRPFKVGDWVRSPDRNIEGTVEYIGWYLTRITTFEKRPLFVPNSIFSTIIVENPSRMHNRRILQTIGLRYQDAKQLKVIVDDLEAMLHAREDIDSTKALYVKFINFGPSALTLQLYAYTNTTDWLTFQRVQEDVLLACYDEIVKHGADLAFPTTTLHVPDSISITQP